MRADPDNQPPLGPTQDLLIREDSVLKRCEPALGRIECEKTRRARKIGEKSGLFLVPRIRSFDEERGVITFDRVTGAEPLKAILTAGRHPAGLLRRVGQSLGTIHDRLTLPDDAIIELPPAWRDADAPDVFIHGDFNVVNVQYVASDDTLVVLDWAATDTISENATRGPAYFDAAWFIHTMVFRKAFGADLIPDPLPKAEEFLAGYETVRPLDRRGFGRYLERTWANVSRRHREKKGAMRFALYRPALSRLRAYARSLYR
jgi:hypothetical protein